MRHLLLYRSIPISTNLRLLLFRRPRPITGPINPINTQSSTEHPASLLPGGSFQLPLHWPPILLTYCERGAGPAGRYGPGRRCSGERRAVFRDGKVEDTGVVGMKTRQRLDPEVRIAHLLAALEEGRAPVSSSAVLVSAAASWTASAAAGAPTAPPTAPPNEPLAEEPSA